MIINGVRIGNGLKPFVIAEISANHNGSLDRALELISKAKKAGASAVKLQSYRPESLTMISDHEDFKIKTGLWSGKTLYELYAEAQMPWEWHEPLFTHARNIGITIFSTPFDEDAVEMLESLSTPAYKIASFELVDHQLIERVALTKKPIIISTGMATYQEIGEALEVAMMGGAENVALLHCISAYPAHVETSNLRAIKSLANEFGVISGLSDHTVDDLAAIAGVAIGAAIVEKHFTLSRQDGGPDDSFSIEPDELARLCKTLESVWMAMGDGSFGVKAAEIENIKFRRSLYFSRNISAGDILTLNDVRSIRPGYGLQPKFLQKLLGKRLKKHKKRASPVQWSDFEGSE